ncbi:response regulator [Sulfuricurvum sp.]|uniref:response regulator n=1 Tax=Sulfuricurvum sp. TaxID=2025608 RepID=UPI0019CB5A71|nr:response regulator [Sulfuricurvum sp.]MBD3799109.1 response regulator [Campylobacterota bacterium]MBD3806372.1 response regulator [Sulfuricurvum sp.]
MNILIIENEIYLAQSIASKLSDLGHNCDISSSTKEGLRGTPYDVVLLSTNIGSQDIYPIIEAYKNAVVILMVSYVSNDTVSKPLAAGAKDYILKPFMIEELIRKIQHFQNHERLKRQNQTYERYLHHTFNSINVNEDVEKTELPLFICSGYQKYADAFAFRYAAHHDKPLQFISLSSAKAFNDIATSDNESVLFIADFQNLKKSEHKTFYELINGRSCIITSTEHVDNAPFKVIEIESDNNLFDQGEILPIEEYVKYIMIHFQNRFPDTELSKKLGISRKSLWEKRKKYGIVKKK